MTDGATPPVRDRSGGEGQLICFRTPQDKTIQCVGMEAPAAGGETL